MKIQSVNFHNYPAYFESLQRAKIDEEIPKVTLNTQLIYILKFGAYFFNVYP